METRGKPVKILVCVKRVVDHTVRVRVKPDGSGIELAGVKMAINPFDEIALEEAVRLKEKGIATEVIALSIGPDNVQEQLRTALALGADKALHIATDVLIQPLAAARLIAAIATRENPQVIFLGKQAIDDDAAQTGPMLAALLGWGQGTFASEVKIENNATLVTRETDGGHVTVRLPLPAVITSDLRLNTPRYATLPNIMKAKSRPIEKLDAASLGVDTAPRLRVIKIEEPPKRARGIRVKDVEELAMRLKTEAKVL